MSNYSALKTDINNNIYENNTQQITGTVLNTVLKDMVAVLGAGYQFAGCAYLDLNPGAPDAKVFYLAGEGLYPNFDNIQVPAGKLGILKWDTRWRLETIEGLGGGGANLTGYISLPSTSDLPEEGQPTIGYLIGENLYLYVGTGGDTADGKYQNCGGFRGPEGVGITDIEQVVESVENGGRNTIRITLSDGHSYDVYVRNGKASQGLFPDATTLNAQRPNPSVGEYAFVGSGFPADIYVCNTAGTWTDSGADYDGDSVDLTDYATKAELNQLEAKVVENGLQKSEFDYSQFNSHESASPAIILDEADEIRLTDAGDYFEIKVQANSSVSILFRPASSNEPRLRYSSQNTLQIRFNSTDNWTYQNAVVDWSKTQTIKVLLDSVSGTTFNYKIYLDGVQVGTPSVTNSTGFPYLVRATTIDLKLYYIETKMGGVVAKMTKFAEMAGAVAVTDVYTYTDVPSLSELDRRVSSITEEVDSLRKATIGENMYFRFAKVSSIFNAESNFYVYQRLKGNYYLATAIVYYVGSNTMPDGYWRIERTNLCTIIDGVVTTIESQIITAGENEFVLQWLAGSGYNFSGGYTGGFHYGETIDNVVGAWVRFVADGHELSTDADIPLTPCKSFFYQEYSPIYQHNDDTIAAWHLKETELKDGGYETINDVKFVQALDYFAYPGIVCVSRWLSEYAMPEGVTTITDMGDGSTTIAEQFKNNGHRIHYEGNGYMCDVESEVLIGADDAQCQRVVYNSSAYNKYYRRNPDTVGSTSNRLKGRTKVKISAM